MQGKNTKQEIIEIANLQIPLLIHSMQLPENKVSICTPADTIEFNQISTVCFWSFPFSNN